MEKEQVFLEKNFNTKRRKERFQNSFQMSHTSLWYLGSKEGDKKDKNKKECCMYDVFYAHLIVTNLKTQK